MSHPRTIDGSTELYGLLGFPIGHSLSPVIYNEFFAQFGMNKVYVPLEASAESFETVFRALKKLRFLGFNVTSPYKETVAGQLDRLEGVAAEIGCVNTISRDGDAWVGRNTDGEGLCRWLESSPSLAIAKQDVVVLGAGNAARAIFRAMLDRGPRSLTVVNRSPKKFEDPFFRKHADAPRVSYAGMDRAQPFKRASLVVNVTSFGLGGREESGPGFPMLSELGEGAVVVDTNYAKDGPTAFLSQLPAGRQGYDGKGMLLYLAREAFVAWTGKDPDLERIAAILGVGALP